MTEVYLTETESAYICPDDVDKNEAPCLLLPNTPNKPGRPTIGVLLARDGDAYEITKDYVRALQKEDINLCFISYEYVSEQIKNCDAIFLPGGAFDSPPEWEEDPTHTTADRRFRAYETLIKEADKKNLPLMGICAGFQMTLGVLYPDKMHLSRVPEERQSFHRQDKKNRAHKVNLTPGSSLEKIFEASEIGVNSSHRQYISVSTAKAMPGVEITALCPEDGIVESVALKKHPNWLVVQWHPEVLADLGDKKMQALFHRFAEEAKLAYVQHNINTKGYNSGRS